MVVKMMEFKRKVIKQTKSLTMSLPKAWCDFNGIKQGNKILLLAGKTLVVVPPNMKEEEIKKLKEGII
jgi:hypothetical protein